MKKLALFSITLLLMGTTSWAQLKCYMIKSPEKVIPGAKKLAIMKFQNQRINNYYYWYRDNYGTQLADYMTTALLDDKRGLGSPVNSVVPDYKPNQMIMIERSQLDQIIKEQQLGASGAIDDNQAAQVGKLLGLSAILSGSYNYSSKDEPTQSTYKTKEGVQKTRHCLKRTATVEATMKIISVETGQILATVTKSAFASDSKCDAARSKVASVQVLTNRAMKSLANYLVSYFVPTLQYVNLDLAKIKVKDYKTRAKDAMAAAREGDLTKAYGIYMAIYGEDNYNPRLAYNLGLVYEAAWEFDKAIEMHKIAYELDDAGRFKNAIKRAEKGKQALQDLKTIGFEYGTYSFDGSETEGITAEVVEKVKTRGQKKERVSVYAEPMKSSDVVAKVPGATEFTVLGTEGPYTLVKLLGGKQGYIHKDDLK